MDATALSTNRKDPITNPKTQRADNLTTESSDPLKNTREKEPPKNETSLKKPLPDRPIGSGVLLPGGEKELLRNLPKKKNPNIKSDRKIGEAMEMIQTWKKLAERYFDPETGSYKKRTEKEAANKMGVSVCALRHDQKLIK